MHRDMYGAFGRPGAIGSPKRRGPPRRFYRTAYRNLRRLKESALAMRWTEVLAIGSEQHREIYGTNTTSLLRFPACSLSLYLPASSLAINLVTKLTKLDFDQYDPGGHVCRQQRIANIS
jgi:hypothetical protein